MLAEARQAFERVYLPGWRSTVVARAVDVTAEHATRSCIVFAPHPDDETLGCGGLIARKRAAGVSVRVVVASTGDRSHSGPSAHGLSALRQREVAEACEVLGVGSDDLVLLGLPDGELASHEDFLVRRVVDEIETHRPDDVFVTSQRDWHPDHQTLGRAAARGAARATWQPRVFEYPIWWWIDGPWRPRDGRDRWHYGVGWAADTIGAFFRAPVLRVATGPFHAAKMRAVAAHRSQVTRMDADSDFVGLDAATLRVLTGRYEVFLPVPIAAGRAAGAIGQSGDGGRGDAVPAGARLRRLQDHALATAGASCGGEARQKEDTTG